MWGNLLLTSGRSRRRDRSFLLSLLCPISIYDITKIKLPHPDIPGPPPPIASPTGCGHRMAHPVAIPVPLLFWKVCNNAVLMQGKFIVSNCPFLGRRFCNMFSKSSPCFLGQHAICSTAQRPGELSENILHNLRNKLPPLTEAIDMVWHLAATHPRLSYVARSAARSLLTLTVALGFLRI